MPFIVLLLPLLLGADSPAEPKLLMPAKILVIIVYLLLGWLVIDLSTPRDLKQRVTISVYAWILGVILFIFFANG